MDTHVVIMAGGIGSRLWPLSTPERPKQFVDILGTGKTLIQMTVDRFRGICPDENFWVVTSEKYVDLVKEQIPSIPVSHILAEPEARNTAPCIAYACRKIALHHPDANIVVTPADALVTETARFSSAILKALEATDGTNKIVTIGITPSRPETGYGYIHSTSTTRGEIVKVSEFKEKPNLETAKEYYSDGHYFWNAGIFVWNVKTVNAELRAHAPGIMEIMDKLEGYFYTDGEQGALRELFPQCEKISIDYAVMEKSKDIYVIADELGWSDLGSWGSVGTHIPSDDKGNAVVGEDVRLFNSEGCVVHIEGEKTAVIEGLKDFIVSVTDSGVVICRLSEEQHIKEFSAKK